MEMMMATFMIVHGSWHWGGCFMTLANELAVRGHKVITPDLCTHGYESTPTGTVVDMAHYTAPAVQLLNSVDGPVILVGHSMAGATCTYLGEQMPERFSLLVYLTAFMCPNGSCPNDYIFSEECQKDPMAAEMFQILSADPLGVRLDLGALAKVKEVFYADCDDRVVEVAAKSVIPVTPNIPYKTLSQTTPQRFGRLPRVYIECTEDKAIPLSVQRKMQSDVPGAKVVSMSASHSPFFSKPAELADILTRAGSTVT
jgi:pimeloyl-ACP methyl ester carboxylesterase